jgi:hypothetical protein
MRMAAEPLECAVVLPGRRILRVIHLRIFGAQGREYSLTTEKEGFRKPPHSVQNERPQCTEDRPFETRVQPSATGRSETNAGSAIAEWRTPVV